MKIITPPSNNLEATWNRTYCRTCDNLISSFSREFSYLKTNMYPCSDITIPALSLYRKVSLSELSPSHAQSECNAALSGSTIEEEVPMHFENGALKELCLILFGC